MAREDYNAIFLGSEVVGVRVKVPFIDRIRFLLGSSIFVSILVETQRRQKIRTKTIYAIEPAFGNRFPKDKLPNLFDTENPYIGWAGKGADAVPVED